MRFAERLLILVFLLSQAAMGQNITRLGRWSEGQSAAVFNWGKYTLIGNGAYLESHLTDDSDGFVDRLMLPGTVKGIWAQTDMTYGLHANVYIACGDAGLQVAYCDSNGILSRIGSLALPGTAEDVMYYHAVARNLVYVACGTAGLALVDVGMASHPDTLGTCAVPGFAKSVWAVNDSTALVAADRAGLISINTAIASHCYVQDDMTFAPVISGFDPRARRVIVIRDTAYVAAGWGGMRIVKVLPNGGLDSISVWSAGTLDVQNCWVTENAGIRSAHLACGANGIVAGINVTDPNNINPASGLMWDSPGFASGITVSGDTAYVVDGYGGLALVRIDPEFGPQAIFTIPSADYTHDVATSGTTGYLAVGRSGVKIFVNMYPSDSLHFSIEGSYDTQGEARGLKRGNGDFLFVADGSRGLTILNVADPQTPELEGLFTAVGDTCYDVAVPAGSYAVLACGQEGIRVVNYSGLPSIVEPSNNRINTPGLARGLETRGDSLFVADSSGVFVYRMNGLSGAYTGMTLVKSLVRSRMDAQAVAVTGDSVFVANGQYGFLIWNMASGQVDSVATIGRCGDLTVKGKTIYLTDSERGLSIVDLSKPSEPKAIAYALTSGDARRLAMSDSKVLIADGPTGMTVFNTTIKPRISVSTQSIQFGSAPPDFERPWPVWITNTGTTILQVTGMDQAGDVGFSVSEKSFSIAPQDTQRIIIRFAPTSPIDINRDAVLVIYSNDSDQPETQITLKGKVSTWVNEGPYASDSFTLGLWHADDVIGQSTAVDASANRFNAQISGGASFSDTSLFGRSVLFLGPNNQSRMSIPFNSAFDFSSSPFTAEFWYRMNRRLLPGERSILFLSGSAVGNDTRQIELALSGDEGLTGRVWNSAGTACSVSAPSMIRMNPDQWYHAAFSWDGDSLRLYLNGVLKNSARLNGLLRTTSGPLVFGADPIGTEAFEGYLDEVRISNVARESWEFHVNRSRLAVDADTLFFGNVLVQKSRQAPLHLSNIGTQPLEIRNLAVLPAGSVSTTFSTDFILDTGRDTTLWATFSPTVPEILDGRKSLVFETSDPTYPTYHLPLSGEAVQSLPAGQYDSDALTLGLWHFNERSGDSTSDASGHRLVGRLRNMTFDTTKKAFDSGSSLGFGNTGGVTVIDTAAGSFQSPTWNGMTVETWFRLDDQVFGSSVLVRRGTLPKAHFDMTLEGNTLVGKWYNTNGDSFRVSTIRGEIQNQQWYHAALVLDSDSLTLFLNSAKKEAVHFTGVPSGSIRDTAIDTLSVLVGRDWAGSMPLNGNVDELRISNVARRVWEFNVKNARIATSAGSLDFSRVLLGSDRTIRLEVRNVGLDTLFINQMAFSTGSPFSVDVSSLVLIEGETRKVNIRYLPQSAGTDLDSLLIVTNDPNWQEKPFRIPVRGIGTVSAVSGAYQTDALTAGLYHFDEESGTTAADSSGLGRPGLLHGDAVWSESGRFDGSLVLPGGGGRVIIPMPSANLDGLTLEGWFNLSSAPPDSSVFLRMGTGANRTEITFDADSGLVGSVWQNSVRTSIPSGTSWLRTGQWMHSALTWDGDSLRFYVNAVLAGTKFLAGPVSLKFLSVGADSSGANPKWQGKADEIRISTSARRAWEMNVVSPRLETVPKERIVFSPVLAGASRVTKVILRNVGNQDLSTKARLKNATAFKLMGSDSILFQLGGGKEDTLVVVFSPMSSISYPDSLIITSNDPARPRIAMSITGTGQSKQDIPHEFTVDSLTLALYHFSEVSGDTTHDETVRYPARVSPEVERTRDGLMSRALKFVDQNGNVQIPLRLDMDHGFSIECHFKTDTVDQLILDQAFGPLYYPLRIFIDTNGRIIADGIGKNGPWVADNAWHGLAFVHQPDVNSSFLYLDGNLIESAQLDTAKQHHRLSQSDTTSLWIGSSIVQTSMSDYKGLLDELRISAIGREPWEFNLRNARVSVSQDTMDFGRVVMGADRTLGLDIRNVGIDTLFIKQMTFDGTSSFSIDMDSLILLPGFARRVNLDYTPAGVGLEKDSLRIFSNDPNWSEDEPFTVQLRGEGLAARTTGSYQTDGFTMGLFHFEDAEGSTASDSSGNGRTGVLRGDAVWSTLGRYGGCLSLPGHNGRIIIGQTAGLIDGFTFEGWFNLAAMPGDSAVFIRMGTADTNRVELSFDVDSGLVGRLSSGGARSVLPSIPGSLRINQWTHTSLTWDGDSLRFYINNILQSLRAFGGPLQWSAVTIGADSSGIRPWNGLVDEIRISSTARRTWDMNVAAPQASILPKKIDFSTVLLEASRTLNVLVTNMGDQVLTYNAKLKSGSVFKILGADSVAGTLGGGRSDTIKIVFRPVSPGLLPDTLIVQSNDPAVSRLSIPISGFAFDRKVSTEFLMDSLTVALYHFNESTGDAAVDQTGRYTARLKNQVYHAADGLLGRALSFNGTDGRLEIPFRLDLSKDMTIECHFKTDTVNQVILDQQFGAQYPFRFELDKNGKLIADGLGKSGPFVCDGAWHSLSFVHQTEADSTALYLDGVLVEAAAMDTVKQKHRIQAIDTSQVFVGAAHDTTDIRNYQGLIDELRFSSYALEKWNFGLPDLGIRVASIEPQAPRFGEPIVFKLGIPAALSPDSVFVYFRQGGKTAFSRLTSVRIPGDTTYQTTIPATEITLNGIEYYLSIRSTTGVGYTYPSLSPATRPLALPVRLNKMRSKLVYTYQQLDDPETKLGGQMVSLFSIPFQLDTVTVKSVLSTPEAFGSYDPYSWRLFWWHRGSSQYREYSTQYDSLNPEVFELEPGRAFWVVSQKEKQFDIRSFQTVSTAAPFAVPIGPGYLKTIPPDTIKIVKGWNMIGNPFPFPVRWEDCVLSSESVSTLYAYEGQKGFRVNWPVLEPWHGYFVCNQDTLQATLTIFPRDTSEAGLLKKADRQELTEGEWMVRVSLESTESGDIDNLAGCRRGASDAWDVRDLPEPPNVVPGASVRFNHPDWKRHAGAYTTDLRSTGKDGHVWEIEIQSRIALHESSLKWELTGSMPQDWQAFLLDPVLQTASKITMTGGRTINVQKNQTARYLLVAGTPEFVAQHSNGIPLTPSVFRLYPNYPNPFNPETSIRFSLPKQDRVELVVFNALGQKVAVLVDKVLQTGEHQILWNGRDGNGRNMASGVYLCRLKQSDRIAVQKMILLR